MMKVTLPQGKQGCILFDTEQSTYDVWKVVKRILRHAGLEEAPHFEAFGLRKLCPADRLFIIEQKIYNTENLGIVVIDGIRDLVNDINSTQEATTISSNLMRWTEERNIHIITVLHQNKGDTNARGHLGTELVNKAEATISVEKKGDLSIVSSEDSRGKDFNPFAFGIDPEGIPYIIDDYETKSDKPTKKLTAFDIPIATHVKILTELFTELGVVTLKYTELENHLKVKFQSNGVDLIQKQVIEFLTFYKQKKILLDEAKKGKQGNPHWINKEFIK